MSPNPFLKQLGLTDNDRAVIFHADDINMCQASLDAYGDLLEFGLMSSAAVMVPCPWFPAAAQYCRDNQAGKQIDVGVHLTLTSEWDHYRWGPISTHDAATGLIDSEGYFFRYNEPVQEQAVIQAVQQEIVAQVERAMAAGIDVTHIDSHMGILLHPRLHPIYFQLSETYQLPAFMLHPGANRWNFEELVDLDLIGPFIESLSALEDSGFPLLDGLEMMSLDKPANRLEEATERLERLPTGISYFIIHPAKDTPELRNIAQDWQCRVADYELFTSDKWRKVIEASGVMIIGWRVLREIMRSA